jgi:hypothetical protein
MNRTVISLASALILTACATHAPSQGYRPAGYTGAPWNITGSVNLLTGSATFDINSQRVIDDRLNLLTGDGEFTGSYQGKPVNASCITKMGFISNVTTCFVFVSGEKVARPHLNLSRSCVSRRDAKLRQKPNRKVNADANSWPWLRHFIGQLLVPYAPSVLRRQLT